MKKAVIVIDMPKRCKYCFWYQADAWFGGSCKQVKDENGWNKHIEADDEYNIQNWCPLKEAKAIPIEWLEKCKDRYILCCTIIDDIIEEWREQNEG